MCLHILALLALLTRLFGRWSPCAVALGGPQAPGGSDGKDVLAPAQLDQRRVLWCSFLVSRVIQGRSLHLEMSPSRLESLVAGLKVEQVPYAQVEIVGDKDRPQR